MSDISAPYGGDVQFDAVGDYLFTAAEEDLSLQRVTRALLTNSAETDSSGNIVLPADDSYNPLYGASLGRIVDQTDSPETRQVAYTNTVSTLAKEPTVDQSVSPTIRFLQDANSGALMMGLTYQTLSGDVVSTGFRL